MRGSLIVVVSLAGALAAASAAPATTVTRVQKDALKALASYPGGREAVNRTAYLARTLPGGRREHVLVALREAAAFKGRATAPRALSLIGMLRANDNYFAKHYAPRPKTDISDEDGVVYRYFAGRCFEFHPLANFGALNAHVAANDVDATQRLADALVARGVYASGKGVGWEYTFNYAGGHAPWLSGMAQAVAAQAFARAATLVPEQQAQYLRSAHAAFRAIPGRLLTTVAAGPWIRLYSFDSLRVLNAQLQAVVSLQSYAASAEDAEAADLATRMQRASAATLNRFDTGYWSYYALPHDPSPVDYHDYVVQLLKRLAPRDTRFADAAARFARYEQEPPAFKLATAGVGSLRFWLSKPAFVSAETAAGRSKRLSLGAGWHTLTWPEPKKPGLYGVRVRATDYAGNATSFDTLPIVRAATSATVTAPLLVGAALDDPSLSGEAQQAGAKLARIGVVWPVGATTPDPSLVAALQQLTLPTIVELNAVPADDTARAALAQYTAGLVAAVPSLSALVLEPAATTATAPAYLATLGALRAALPTTPLGVAVDGGPDAESTLAAFTGVPVNAYVFRPAPNGLTVPEVVETLASEYGSPLPLYLDGPAPATVGDLSCEPGVTAVLLDHLADVAVPSVRAAQRGSIVCPGLSAQVSATAVEYPTTIAAPVSIRLGCDRDCLYVVALERNGRPVAARRGALNGGAAAATIGLPKVKLTRGTYTFEVRLVAQANPGGVTALASPPVAKP